MASNVINRWFKNYRPSILLKAITLAMMYLILTSNHLFVLWHRYQVGCEEFHNRKQSNQFPMRTKQWAVNRKGHKI